MRIHYIDQPEYSRQYIKGRLHILLKKRKDLKQELKIGIKDGTIPGLLTIKYKYTIMMIETEVRCLRNIWYNNFLKQK